MSDIINSSLKTAVKGTSLVFAGMVSSILLWFATKVLIIRYTTKEELGLYSIVVAAAGILSVCACLGIQEGVSRYISVFWGEDRKDDADSMARSAVRSGILSGIFFFLVLFSASGIIARYVFYKPELEAPLKVISFFIPFFVMANIMSGILRGHNLIAPKVFIMEIGQPLFFLALLCSFFYLNLPFISVIYAYLLAIIAVFILIGVYGYKKTGVNPLLLKGSSYNNELIKFSVPLLIAAVLGLVLTWCDTLMLGRYARAEDVGAYNVSISLAKLLTFPLGALEFVYMPIACSMYAKKQNPELNKTYQVLTKWNFSATLPIFFILFFFPEMTITFLFGERFLDSSMPLRILSLCFLFHAFLGANGTLMVVMGKSKDLMNVSIFGALLNILLNYILIKHLGYGTIGASVATLISYFALNVIISVMLYRISRIHPITSQYIKPVISSAVVGIIIYAIAKSLPLYLWMLPLYFIMFIGGFFMSLIITRSIGEEDSAMFEAISERTGLKISRLQKIFYR